MNFCPPTAGARDWWGQGFGISPREPALDLEQVPFGASASPSSPSLSSFLLLFPEGHPLHSP